MMFAHVEEYLTLNFVSMMFAHVEEYLTLKLCEYDVCSC